MYTTWLYCHYNGFRCRRLLDLQCFSSRCTPPVFIYELPRSTSHLVLLSQRETDAWITWITDLLLFIFVLKMVLLSSLLSVSMMVINVTYFSQVKKPICLEVTEANILQLGGGREGRERDVISFALGDMHFHLNRNSRPSTKKTGMEEKREEKVFTRPPLLPQISLVWNKSQEIYILGGWH